jgi:anti-anti-sigma factor
LNADKQPVRLDLSQLGFIDSSGMHLLIAALNDAASDGWRLEVLPSLAPNVEQSLRLARLQRILTGPHLN